MGNSLIVAADKWYRMGKVELGPYERTPDNQVIDHSGQFTAYNPFSNHSPEVTIQGKTMDEAQNNSAIRVLLADDHELMRKGITQLLEDDPCILNVGEAHDGQEAIEMTKKYRPDVVLMDVSMPGISGIEATREIKASMPEVSIIGLSMHDMDGISANMMDAGADRYLTKDGSVETLVNTIRELGGSTP